ncbi:MAG: ABC transporter ATP-binding protein [Planctomycetota bacterium]
MVSVTLHDVSKSYGRTAAVSGVTMEAPQGGLTFLLGPSGCGKTTILRMVAGFLEPTAGTIRFGDRDVTQVPAERRDCGMVFQGYALWPHMTVEQNVAFGLEVRKVPSAEVRRRVGEALELVRMGPYAARRPNELSGGQQQRVALARAVVYRPNVLLLDEPLSNLDAKLRLEMRHEIRRIVDTLKITTVYVTHDQEEALSLADGIVVMRDGRIEQQGGARDLYGRPRNRFVAEFMGETNLVAGRVVAGDANGCSVETAAGRLDSATPGLATGQAVTVSVRPESLRITPTGAIEGRCRESVYLGETAQHLVDTAVGTLKVFELDPRTTSRAGQGLRLQADRDAVVALTD